MQTPDLRKECSLDKVMAILQADPGWESMMGREPDAREQIMLYWTWCVCGTWMLDRVMEMENGRQAAIDNPG